MNCRNRVVLCKRDNWRLLDENFKLKLIKRRDKIPFWQLKANIQHSTIAYQFITALTSPNIYVSRKLNNIKEANLLKKEYNNWTKLYHKLLQGIETMIDILKQVQNIIMLVEEMNITITEIEGTILKASNNHWTLNIANIFSISKDL